MAEIIKIGENTWSFEDGFVRFFLLAGDEKAVMIDSGMNCPDALEQAKALIDTPIMLLKTHGDGDHTSATSSFSEIYIPDQFVAGFQFNGDHPIGGYSPFRIVFDFVQVHRFIGLEPQSFFIG